MTIQEISVIHLYLKRNGFELIEMKEFLDSLSFQEKESLLEMANKWSEYPV